MNWIVRTFAFGMAGLRAGLAIMGVGFLLILLGIETTPMSDVGLDLGPIGIKAKTGMPGVLALVLGVALVAITRPSRRTPGGRR